MPETVFIEHQIKPEFDLEEFMNFAHETRLSNEALQHLLALWETWGTSINAREIKNGENSWLAIWLPEEIEQKVDEAWEKSPAEGFLINSLAQYMCMCSANTLLPETGEGGCAPAPVPDSGLKKALQKLGLGEMETGLSRRYALVTYYPFQGGCEICGLQENCPRNISEPAFATVTLPGHELGETD